MKSRLMSSIVSRLESDMPNTFSVIHSLQRWSRSRRRQMHDDRLAAAVKKAKPYAAYILVGALFPTGDHREQAS